MNEYIILSTIVVVIFGILMLYSNRPKLIRAHYDKELELMTLTYSNGKIKQYSGECTVWHRLPNYKRCSTLKESELCDYWQHNIKNGTYIRK